jgi:hypothetical protein
MFKSFDLNLCKRRNRTLYEIATDRKFNQEIHEDRRNSEAKHTKIRTHLPPLRWITFTDGASCVCYGTQPNCSTVRRSPDQRGSSITDPLSSKKKSGCMTRTTPVRANKRLAGSTSAREATGPRYGLRRQMASTLHLSRKA